MDKMKINGQSDVKLCSLKLITRNQCYCCYSFKTGRTEELEKYESGRKGSNGQQQGGNLESVMANNVARERSAS